jgi:hypothetical protein
VFVLLRQSFPAPFKALVLLVAIPIFFVLDAFTVRLIRHVRD